MKCNDKILDLSTPQIMGILNVTPDSFYDGGKYNSLSCWVKQTEMMISEGASIIDIGAVSTRPGAQKINEKEELQRILPALKLIRKEFNNIIISIDTYHSSIAKATFEYGADMINDISGGTYDDKMFSIISYCKIPYVIMHIKGTPKNMQLDPRYDNIIMEIKDFIKTQVFELEKQGVHDIIIDPGFGFGKSLENNYELLSHLKDFKEFGYPIMVGISRKSMINKILKTKPEEALTGTIVLHTIALLNGANILRVHDVKEAVETQKLVSYYLAS